MDYRKFLGATETLTLPWLSGGSVDAPGRRLRLSARPPAAGWYLFTVKGRVATPGEQAPGGDLGALPAVRGWLIGDQLVTEGARFEPVHLLPDEEAPRFSPVVARRWHSGELLFDSLEFETEAEAAAREALAQRGPLTNKGIAAPLRAAYGFALIEAVARRGGAPVSTGEVRNRLGQIAAGGEGVAEQVLAALEAERERARRELAELERTRQTRLMHEQVAAARVQRRAQGTEPALRAEEALERAGARLESARRLGDDRLEVVFAFMGMRFVSIVDSTTLQVRDSGICLGHPPRDDLVTLDSLPSVIREAIDTDALVILRRP